MIGWRDVIGGIAAWWAIILLLVCFVLSPTYAMQYATIAIGLLLFGLYWRLGRPDRP